MAGCVWVGESFLKNDKWQIQLLSEFFFQLTFNLLWMTQTQEIITHRVSKIHKWIWGMCMSGGKFLKEWQVTNKIIESINFMLLSMTHPTPTWPTLPLQPTHPYMTWKIRVQECKGGGAGSCQWCHVTSHDVISMIQGVGWVMEIWPASSADV